MWSGHSDAACCVGACCVRVECVLRHVTNAGVAGWPLASHSVVCLVRCCLRVQVLSARYYCQHGTSAATGGGAGGSSDTGFSMEQVDGGQATGLPSSMATSESAAPHGRGTAAVAPAPCTPALAEAPDADAVVPITRQPHAPGGLPPMHLEPSPPGVEQPRPVVGAAYGVFSAGQEAKARPGAGPAASAGPRSRKRGVPPRVGRTASGGRMGRPTLHTAGSGGGSGKARQRHTIQRDMDAGGGSDSEEDAGNDLSNAVVTPGGTRRPPRHQSMWVRLVESLLPLSVVHAWMRSKVRSAPVSHIRAHARALARRG